MDTDLENALDRAAESYPYPIAAACAEVRDTEPRDDWHEWELLSRDLLTPVLTYLSHLLLSDLVATGREPAHLFHRIEAILSRPLAGHYVGFLRETAKYYREEEVETAVPELIDFLLAADVDNERGPDEKPLLGTLVNYRNLWAHGRIEDEEVLAENLEQIRLLTERLLEDLAFLTEYPLTREDGTVLMGEDPPLTESPEPLVVISAGEVALRPLLLKLEGADLMMLSDLDLSKRRLDYRGQETFVRLTEEDIEEDGEAQRIYEELRGLVDEVRALEAPLPSPDWESFKRRASVETDRMLTQYGDENAGKYVPDLFVPRPRWEGDESPFAEFMDSDETLLAITGEQGTGKSALAGHLATQCEDEGHAVWFINGQRFTFADVQWSGTPYPEYFANRLNYERSFDRKVIKRLVNSAPDDKNVVLFIDAIDEVDGINNKWNRFRAMNLLLEWIVEVAQPGLKVVLTFRMDAYEEFDYLQPEEWPEGLLDVAYSGDHPRKPWAMELEPFGAEQARQYYKHLQELPERGMAPEMDWDQVREGLGSEVETFTSIPLLFQIFLRAHHGRSDIITTDQEELFERYANKLTGRAEAKHRPWWKKAWGFLKNGDILPKEQFLADLVNKMAENGNTGVLLERIDPNKSDRDKRMHTALRKQKGRTILDELEEGGIISSEKMREHKKKKPKTRISGINTIITRPLSIIWKKTEKRNSLSESLKLLVTAAIVLHAIIGISAYLMYVGLTSKSYNIAYSATTVYVYICEIMTQVGLITASIFMVWETYTRKIIGPRDIGLILASLRQKINLKSGLFRLTMWVLLPQSLFTLFLALSDKSTWLATMPLSTTLILFLALTPLLIFEALSHSDIHYPIYIIRHYFGKLSNLGKIYKYDRLIFLCVLTPFFATVTYYWFLNEISTWHFTSYSISGLKLNILYHIFHDIVNSRHLNLFLLVSVWTPFMIIPLACRILEEYRVFLHKYFFDRPHKFSSKNNFLFKYSLAINLTVLVVFLMSTKIDFLRKKNTNLEEEVITLDITKFRNIEEGKRVSLNIGSHIEGDILDMLYGAKNISHVDINTTVGEPVDISKIPRIKSVEGPASMIHVSNELSIDSLKLTKHCQNADSWNDPISTYHLHLSCDSIEWNILENKINDVISISLHDDPQKHVEYMNTFEGNTILRTSGEEPLNLRWLDNQSSRYIIVNDTTLSKRIRNLHYVERLFTHLQPEDVDKLYKADRLKWIVISPKDVSHEFVNELKDVLDNGLPRIETLEFSSGLSGKSITARGRSEIIKLLDELRNHPDTLNLE